ncbi:MAG: LicD family protein [Lachnospiraceae bacterium]|nr:LicD family protein [Lachnospiraceae bacterium]
MKYSAKDLIVLDEKNLRQYQLAVLDAAEEIIAFFDHEKIRYSLSGGSILGAVRHQGFIPWDDDIDINIPRADYNRMLRIFDRKMGDRYFLQTPKKCPELGLMVTQIRKKGTVARRKYDWNTSAEKCGISLDIYILENVFDNPVLRFIQKNIAMGFSFAVAAVRFYNNRELPPEIEAAEGRAYQFKRFKLFAGRLLRIIPLGNWIAWCDFWNSACKDPGTKRVAIPTGRKHFSKEIYRRKDMCRFRKAMFEGKSFNIPAASEKYLACFYGDYMTLPPLDKREKHVFLELSY